MRPMRRLVRAPELLDGPLDDPAALEGNLRDLRRVNRFLGGTRLSARGVEVLLGARQGAWSLLDVGTGGADIPVTLVRAAQLARIDLRVVGLDSREEVIAAARRTDPRIDRLRELSLVISDGRSLPYPDRAFDVVHASLLLHHLEPAAAVALLREAGRVARVGVVVNDLVRARRHVVAARALATVATRNRYTRHDAPLSVRRAYTVTELRALLASAGLLPVAEFRGLLGHRVALAARPIPSTRDE